MSDESCSCVDLEIGLNTARMQDLLPNCDMWMLETTVVILLSSEFGDWDDDHMILRMVLVAVGPGADCS